MRYYCKNCQSVFEPNGWHEYRDDGSCPFCKAGCLVVKIPDYETPEQYEERTGKELPPGSAVWFRMPGVAEIYDGWNVLPYHSALRWKQDAEKNAGRVLPADILVANPCPPPEEKEREIEFISDRVK